MLRGLGRYICREEVSAKCDRGKIKQETQPEGDGLGKQGGEEDVESPTERNSGEREGKRDGG